MSEGATRTLTDVVNELTSRPEPLEDVIAALPKGTGGLYQAVISKGYGAGHTKGREDTTAAEAEAVRLKAENEALSTRLTEAERAAPDVEKVTRQFQESERGLKEKHENDLAQLRTRLENAEYGNAVAGLEAKLLAKGLKPIHARVRAKDLRERVRFLDDGKLQVLQKGRDIPIDHDDPLEALADEAAAEADPEEKAAAIARGPGLAQNGARGGAGNSTADRHRRTREAVAKKFGLDEKDTFAARRAAVLTPATGR